jgi:hypothetical protein
MLRLGLKAGVAERLVWSRPDSLIAPFCSLCCGHIADDEVPPLTMWDAEGGCVQFCDRCAAEVIEVTK